MKDEQRTARIMDWLEDRLSPEEIQAFEKERAADADFAEECRIMTELIAGLHDLDRDIEPSGDFHQSLMAKLYQEKESQASYTSEAVLMDTADSAKLESSGLNKGAGHDWQKKLSAGKGKEKEKRPSFKDFISFLRHRPLVPVVAACSLVLVLVYGGGGSLSFGSKGQGSPDEMYYSSSNYDNGASAGSAPATPMAESFNSGGGMVIESQKIRGGGTAASPAMPPAADQNSRLNDTFDNVAAEEPRFMAEGSGQADTLSAEPIEQKIIRTGNINLEVDRHDEAIVTIKSAALSLGGYVTGESSYLIDGRERKAGNIQVKVPYDRYDQLVEQVEALGKVTNSGSNAVDVTSQYVDLKARIQVYETKQERLLALLNQSGDLAAILSIENELANTNAELESLKGQMRYLLDRTDYSTLDISLMEKMPEAVEIKTTGFAGFIQKLKESFFLGVNGLIAEVGSFILWLAENLIGIIIVLVLLWFFWIKVLRRRWRGRRSSD